MRLKVKHIVISIALLNAFISFFDSGVFDKSLDEQTLWGFIKGLVYIFSWMFIGIGLVVWVVDNFNKDIHL